MLARVENHSGYDTGDLERFFEAGLRALGARRSILIVVTSAPKRSRACADVGRVVCSRGRCRVDGRRRMSFALAPPSYGTRAGFIRRLACLLRHEYGHVIGYEHDDMPEDMLYSLGPTPSWAKGRTIRYRRRAPSQVRLLVGQGETP